MASYMITYDLVKDRDYEKVITAIKDKGGVALLESVWLLSMENTAAEVRDWLEGKTDNDDKIAVLSISGGWATQRVDKAATTWLYDHM